MELSSGDKLLIAAGNSRMTWTVSAVNNQVVKYFDENNRYGQIPVVHLQAMIDNKQVEIVPNPDVV